MHSNQLTNQFTNRLTGRFTSSFTGIFSVVIAAVVLCSCAHPISVVPEASKITLPSEVKPINKNIAYYISDDLRNKVVNSPGGGGDSVSYSPYRDMEIAIYKMLTNVFENVTKIKSADDAEAIQKNGISFVFTPEISTTSSSSSAFTWPPTQFDIDLTCKITDAAGKAIFSPKVHGSGASEFSEFKTDFSLASKRAALDVILKMQRTLLDAPELQN